MHFYMRVITHHFGLRREISLASWISFSILSVRPNGEQSVNHFPLFFFFLILKWRIFISVGREPFK